MKAFLIDPSQCSITEVEYDDSNYRNICKMIGAELFDVVRLNEAGDVAYVDDNGLFSDKPFFKYHDYPYPLAGKALVLGTDSKGESISPVTETIETLEENVTFISTNTAILMGEIIDAVNAETKKIYGDSFIAMPVADIIKERE